MSCALYHCGSAGIGDKVYVPRLASMASPLALEHEEWHKEVRHDPTVPVAKRNHLQRLVQALQVIHFYNSGPLPLAN